MARELVDRLLHEARSMGARSGVTPGHGQAGGAGDSGQ